MRTIGIVTTSRADFGIYRPLVRLILQDPALRLHLVVSGTHLSPEFGSTIREIEDEGIPVGDRVAMLLSSDSPEGIAKSMGLGVIGFAQSYAMNRPDILLVLGDRFEMHAAALAALPFKIPVAHIHGGEITEGAIDDALRHSITKLSHLHFVSTKEYAQRVMQLGEEPWRVTVSGAPSLDNLRDFEPLELDELEARVGMALTKRGFLLVTFHPVTYEYERAVEQSEELLAAIDAVEMPALITLPNADTAGRQVRDRLLKYASSNFKAGAVENLGTQAYFSAMSYAAAMVGNSSSGLLEAPSFGLPVVNIGTRQAGRLTSPNVVDAQCKRKDIQSSILRAVSAEFRKSLKNMSNPNGDGLASESIIGRIKEVQIDDELIIKRFHNLDRKNQ